MTWYARAWTSLAGPDGPQRTGVPAAELLAPLPLACVALLLVNDWVLKPSAAPGWLTGKLSDVAGLAMFPLVMTAALDCVLALFAKLVPAGAIDFTLRRWKLIVACLLTGIVFTAMKLSPDVARAMASALTALTRGSHIVADPTDLIALPALLVAYLHGRRAIARGSYGRLAFARMRHAVGRSLEAPFADAAACGANADLVVALDIATNTWLASGPEEAVNVALTRLRR
jgi:hypothetical protein